MNSQSRKAMSATIPSAGINWMQEQMAVRRAKLNLEKEESERRIQEEKLELWSPYLSQVQHTQELNIAWKDALNFFTYDFILATMESNRENDLFCSLNALRITGHDLIQGAKLLEFIISQAQLHLHSLSLIQCQLTSLPHDIGQCIHLKELILTKNAIRELPDSIGNCTQMEFINVSSNRLVALPPSVQHWTLLQRGHFEKNQLTSIPARSICRWKRIKQLNFDQNEITEIPEAKWKDLRALTSFSMNQNALSKLPSSLMLCPALQRLSVCRNRIKILPPNIHLCHSLEALYLDWNKLNTLPLTLASLATKYHLKDCRVEVGSFWILETLKYLHIHKFTFVYIHIFICSYSYIHNFTKKPY